MTVGANHPGGTQTLLLKSAISEYRTFAMHSFASLREIRMPHLTTDDGVKLYYEEVGAALRSCSFMSSPATVVPGSISFAGATRPVHCIQRRLLPFIGVRTSLLTHLR
jgi:hypothetical protein